MNKRIFAIFLIAIFLIVSVGVISAADDQSDLSADVDVKTVSNSKIISVKVIWDDADKTSERPDSVKVNLVKDGAVVDTVTLKESNSWSATFKAQSDDGTFKVSEVGNIDSYSVSTSGSADSGFIIVNKVKADVLGASDDEAPVAEENPSEDAKELGDAAPDDGAADENNTSDINATDEEPTSGDDNATDEEPASDDDNATDEEPASDDATDEKTTADNSTEKVKNTPTKEPVTKEKVKKTIKPVKKNNVTKEKLRNTGIPLMILVVAAFAAIFVPISRNKK